AATTGVTNDQKPAKMTPRTATLASFLSRCESFKVRGNLTTTSLRSRGVQVSEQHGTPNRTCAFIGTQIDDCAIDISPIVVTAFLGRNWSDGQERPSLLTQTSL